MQALVVDQRFVRMNPLKETWHTRLLCQTNILVLNCSFLRLVGSDRHRYFREMMHEVKETFSPYVLAMVRYVCLL